MATFMQQDIDIEALSCDNRAQGPSYTVLLLSPQLNVHTRFRPQAGSDR